VTEGSAHAAATWMCEQIEQHGVLYQDEAAAVITERFGDECTYVNDNGNLAINRDILSEFRTATEKTVVWDAAERMWRRREEYDSPGRRANE